MQKTIVITDLTKMWGDGVCIAGIDHHSQCIRPVLPGGVRRRHLYVGNMLVIRPRAKVKFDFNEVPIKPPHMENFGFDPSSIKYQGSCADTEWETVLQESLFRSVHDIYDGLLQEGRWVAPGANTRSLGTVTQIQIREVRLEIQTGNRRYRLYFTDAMGHQYDDVTISEMAFRAFSDAQANRLGSSIAASTYVKNLLRGADRLYLRLGLAGPWAPPNTSFGLRCWMQVTGIYTFPDYLEGKSFADF